MQVEYNPVAFLDALGVEFDGVTVLIDNDLRVLSPAAIPRQLDVWRRRRA